MNSEQIELRAKEKVSQERQGKRRKTEEVDSGSLGLSRRWVQWFLRPWKKAVVNKHASKPKLKICEKDLSN